MTSRLRTTAVENQIFILNFFIQIHLSLIVNYTELCI